MFGRRRAWLPFAILFGIAALFLFPLLVKALWNWLMPAVFHLGMITYWQALGILVLSKILFGGFRGRPGPHRYWRRRMMERWAHMTPEEREKLRQSMQARCGWARESASPTKA